MAQTTRDAVEQMKMTVGQTGHNHYITTSVPDMLDSLLAEKESAEARVAKLEAALEPFASAWRIAKATGLTSMGQLGPLARNEVGAISFLKANASIAQKGGQ